MRYLLMGKINIIGSHKDVMEALGVLLKIEDLKEMVEAGKEGQIRLKIQDAIQSSHLKADILFDGNTVYDMARILNNIRAIINQGTLYYKKRPRFFKVGSTLSLPTPDKVVLSDYTYKFFTNCCGSIAHYNIQGWVATYPTLEDLKTFFQKNEFGKPVRENIPEWHTDAVKIVKAIEQMLFPFHHYMEIQAGNANEQSATDSVKKTL